MLFQELLEACSDGSRESADIIKDILEADPTLLLHKNRHGVTPLMMAVLNGNTEIVNLLLKYKNPLLLTVRSPGDGNTLLMMAAEAGFEDITRSLASAFVANDIPLTTKNYFGQTAFDLANFPCKTIITDAIRKRVSLRNLERAFSDNLLEYINDFL